MPKFDAKFSEEVPTECLETKKKSCFDHIIYLFFSSSVMLICEGTKWNVFTREFRALNCATFPAGKHFALYLYPERFARLVPRLTSDFNLMFTDATVTQATAKPESGPVDRFQPLNKRNYSFEYNTSCTQAFWCLSKLVWERQLFISPKMLQCFLLWRKKQKTKTMCVCACVHRNVETQIAVECRNFWHVQTA